MPPDPIYTTDNCSAKNRILWTLALFWRNERIGGDWLPELEEATEKDGVHIKNHSVHKERADQFLLHCDADLAAKDIIRSVKGRLQYIIRSACPKAFRRNYSIKSIGTIKAEIIQKYVSSQFSHHPRFDPRVAERFEKFQLRFPDVDLSATRYSSHGQFIHNLHLVFVHERRWCEYEDEVMWKVTDMIRKAAKSKEHLLSAAGVLPDHVHLSIGCGISDAPREVALSYLNNLAYAQGMQPVYQFGYYAGTFGKYDLGAIP